MEKFEYFSGMPEVGIVPRAPHAGPLMRHVYEQEHGRGGFAGKVSHTYHLYPPTNWLPEESRLLDGAGSRRTGSRRCVLSAASTTRSASLRPEPRARRLPRHGAPDRQRDGGDERDGAGRADGLLLRAPLGHAGLLRPRGLGHARDHVRAHRVRARAISSIIPKGITHRFECDPGPQYYWVYESFAGDPEKAEARDDGAVPDP